MSEAPPFWPAWIAGLTKDCDPVNGPSGERCRAMWRAERLLAQRDRVRIPPQLIGTKPWLDLVEDALELQQG